VRSVASLIQIIVLLSISIATNAQSPGTPIGVGAIAPDFTLEDQNGHKTTLSDARGKSPAVLVFYRGYW
jgi:cytochrome oxidase Cu insertion factor (SCO1/SenC/PrrC family)